MARVSAAVPRAGRGSRSPMAKPSKRALVRALLDRHGRTYAEEPEIRLGRPTARNLFRLLTASLLYSARIDARIATDAARRLAKRGWNTADEDFPRLVGALVRTELDDDYDEVRRAARS